MKLSPRRVLNLVVFLCATGLFIQNAAGVDSENTYQGADVGSQYTDHQLRMSGTDRLGNTAPTSADELDAIRQHVLYADYLLSAVVGMVFFYFSVQAFSLRLNR